MKTLLISAVAALLAIPALAAAGDYTLPPSNAASAACKAERASNPALFKQTYGTNKNKSNALGKCISKHTKTETANQNNAAKECRAEQADTTFATTHGKTFDEFYATNKKGSNAFGKCVSSKAKAKSNADVKADVKAMKSCKADRKADADQFRADWGGKRNAFGKCVSATAKTLHA